MTLPKLVSFSGYATAGKDAAADLLVTRARFVKTHMTKPLELTLVKLNPWIVDQKEETIERFADLYENLGDRAIKDFEESRRLLQALETEVGRENGDNVWINKVFEEVESLLKLDKKVALAGVQTPQEIKLIHMYDGVCVWIERPVKRRYGIDITAEDCDLVVENDGSLKEFYVKLIVALETYTNKMEKINNVG